jgi:hypothetical protein
MMQRSPMVRPMIRHFPMVRFIRMIRPSSDDSIFGDDSSSSAKLSFSDDSSNIRMTKEFE